MIQNRNKDCFFVIDSEKLRDVRPGLFGVMICDGNIYYESTVPDTITNIGYFDMITVQDELIRVRQDFLGSFGIYVYREGKHFAVSNSFFFLADYLKGRKLTPNKEAATALFAGVYVPISYTDTLAAEIVKLDSQSEVIIDINAKTMKVENKAFPYFQRKLDNAAGFRALDEWYERWVSLLRNLASQGYPIYSDLSGGLDTRIIISMLINAGIDLNSVCVLSHKKINLAKDKDDYRIASEIAHDYGFSLNRDPYDAVSVGTIDPLDSFSNCRLCSYGKTITNKYGLTQYIEPVVFLKGLSSSIKGNTWEGKVSVAYRQYTDNYRELFKGIPYFFHFSSRKADRYIKSQIGLILKNCRFHDDRDASIIFQKLIAERLDCGKALDWLANNHMVLSPFIDPELVKFDYNRGDRRDMLFLSLMILDRYCPKLLNYEIQGRKIKPETLEQLRVLNGKYPLERTIQKEKMIYTPSPIRKKTIGSAKMGEFLEGIWLKNDFKERTEKYLDRMLVEHTIKTTAKEKMNSKAQPMNALLAIYEFDQLASNKP